MVKSVFPNSVGTLLPSGLHVSPTEMLKRKIALDQREKLVKGQEWRLSAEKLPVFVQDGAIEVWINQQNSGEEILQDFAFRGEVLGFEQQPSSQPALFNYRIVALKNGALISPLNKTGLTQYLNETSRQNHSLLPFPVASMSGQPILHQSRRVLLNDVAEFLLWIMAKLERNNLVSTNPFQQKIIELPMPRTAIATYLKCNSEVLSRQFSELEAKHYIQIYQINTITVLDLARLTALAQGHAVAAA